MENSKTPYNDQEISALPQRLAGNMIDFDGNGIQYSYYFVYYYDPSTEIGPPGSDQVTILRNLCCGQKWGGNFGVGAYLTYSFYNPGVSVYSSSEKEARMAFALTPSQQTAAFQAMSAYSNICDIKFSSRPDSAKGAGDIRWANTSDPSLSTAGTYTPNSYGMGGDIWFGTKYGASYQNPVPGNYGYYTFIHELGHALGLRHPHDSSVCPPLSGHDQVKYTIMSYRGYEDQSMSKGLSLDFFPTTPMIDDILAMQMLYGANKTYRIGDTTYSWSPDAKIFETIWDAGGNDTIDASNQVRPAIINLEPGSLSSIGSPIFNGKEYMRDTLGIAYGAIIENAKGTKYNDTITGNSADNLLVGNDGNDTIVGNAGNDTLAGGPGSDLLIGGSGRDVFLFDSLPNSLAVDTIKDFYPKEDVIALDRNFFMSFNYVGKLKNENFCCSDTGQALDAQDIIIYQPKSGIIFYDSDGIGGGVAIPVVVVGANLPLSVSNFMVV